MLWRKLAEDLAKVGVEGSNPFARSKIIDENQKVKSGHSRRFSLTELQTAFNVSSL